jgi:hypothetical protein
MLLMVYVKANSAKSETCVPGARVADVSSSVSKNDAVPFALNPKVVQQPCSER